MKYFKYMVLTAMAFLALAGAVSASNYSDAYIYNAIFDSTNNAMIFKAATTIDTVGLRGVSKFTWNTILNRAFDPATKSLRISVIGGGSGGSDTSNYSWYSDTANYAKRANATEILGIPISFSGHAPVTNDVMEYNGSTWVASAGSQNYFRRAVLDTAFAGADIESLLVVHGKTNMLGNTYFQVFDSSGRSLFEIRDDSSMVFNGQIYATSLRTSGGKVSNIYNDSGFYSTAIPPSHAKPFKFFFSDWGDTNTILAISKDGMTAKKQLMLENNYFIYQRDTANVSSLAGAWLNLNSNIVNKNKTVLNVAPGGFEIASYNYLDEVGTYVGTVHWKMLRDSLYTVINDSVLLNLQLRVKGRANFDSLYLSFARISDSASVLFRVSLGDRFFLGTNAGRNVTSGAYSNFFGQQAGMNATSVVNSNFFGYNSGYGSVALLNANCFGYQTGLGADSAAHLFAAGYRAGALAAKDSFGILIGRFAGYNTTGSYMSAFGDSAGFAENNSHVFIFGKHANATADSQFFIGGDIKDLVMGMSGSSITTYRVSADSFVGALRGSATAIKLIGDSIYNVTKIYVGTSRGRILTIGDTIQVKHPLYMSTNYSKFWAGSDKGIDFEGTVSAGNDVSESYPNTAFRAGATCQGILTSLYTGIGTISISNGGSYPDSSSIVIYGGVDRNYSIGIGTMDTLNGLWAGTDRITSWEPHYFTQGIVMGGTAADSLVKVSYIMMADSGAVYSDGGWTRIRGGGNGFAFMSHDTTVAYVENTVWKQSWDIMGSDGTQHIYGFSSLRGDTLGATYDIFTKNLSADTVKTSLVGKFQFGNAGANTTDTLVVTGVGPANTVANVNYVYDSAASTYNALQYRVAVDTVFVIRQAATDPDSVGYTIMKSR